MEHPAQSFQPPEACLALQNDGLDPSEHSFDPFALPLTDRGTVMPRCAIIDRAPTVGLVLRHMGVTFDRPHRRYKAMRIVAVIRPNVTHRQCALPPIIAGAASRSAVPLASVSRTSTSSPCRFSVRRVPDSPVSLRLRASCCLHPLRVLDLARGVVDNGNQVVPAVVPKPAVTAAINVQRHACHQSALVPPAMRSSVPLFPHESNSSAKRFGKPQGRLPQELRLARDHHARGGEAFCGNASSLSGS